MIINNNRATIAMSDVTVRACTCSTHKHQLLELRNPFTHNICKYYLDENASNVMCEAIVSV